MSILIIVGLALVALIAGYVMWKKDFRRPTKRVRVLQSAGASIAAVALVLTSGTFVSFVMEQFVNVDGNIKLVSSKSSYDSVDELVARVKERAEAGDFDGLTNQNVGSIKEHRYYAYDADPGSFNFGPNPGFTKATTADEALETYVYVLLTDPLNAAASYEMRDALEQERFYNLEGVKAYADEHLVNSYENRERELKKFLKSIDIESVKLVNLPYQYNTLGMKPGSDPSVMPELIQFDNLPYMNLTLAIRTKEGKGMLLRTDCLFQPSIPVTPKQEQSFYESVPKVQAKQQPQPTQPRVTITPGKQKPPAPPAPPSTQTTVTQPPKTTTTTTEKTTTETTTLPPKTTTSTTTTTKPPKTTTETTTTTTEKTTTPKTTEPSTSTTTPRTTTPKTTEPTTETTTTTSLEPKDPEEDPAKNGDAPAPQEPTITEENPEPEPSAAPTDVMPDEPTNPAPPEPTTIPRDPVEDETEVVIPPVEGGATPEDPVEGIIESPWFDPDPSYEESTADTSGYNENIVEDPAPVVSDPIVHEPINPDPIVVEDAPSGPAETSSDPIPVVDNGEVVTDAIELSSVSETTNNEYLKGIAALAVLAILYAGIAVWRRRSN